MILFPNISIFNRRSGAAGPNWVTYWSSRYPSLLILTIDSDTQVTPSWTNNGTQDYDYISLERSTDEVAWAELIQLAANTASYANSGLTTELNYFYRLRYVKSGTYSAYTDISNVVLSTLNQGLIDFWHLDEASGNATGINGNVLTNNNTATYVAAVIGNGVSLGTYNTNKSLSKNSDFGLTYNTPQSIAGWVQVTSDVGVGATFAFFTQLYATNPGTWVNLRYENNAGVITLFGTGNVRYTITLAIGTWHHFAVTWDNINNVSKIYMNGILIITDVCFTSNYSAQTSTFSIGKLITSFYASVKEDEIGFYSKLLTENEILQLAMGKTAPFRSDIIGKSVCPAVAYCWFNSVKSLYNSAANKTWINVTHIDDSAPISGYIQHILTLNNATGVVTKTKIGTVYEYDDHNEGSTLVRSSDNKLFTTFTEHGKAGSLIKYRISTNALDATAWGAVTSIDPSNPSVYTYMNCFEVANGDIYLIYRETYGADNWWSYVKSTDGGVNFGARTKFFFRDYLRITQSETNRNILHFLGSVHPDRLADPDVVSHFYFDAGDATFHKSDGTDVTAHIPLLDAYMTPIMTVTGGDKQAWIEDITLDANGYPRVLMMYLPTRQSNPLPKYLYYSEWTGSAWTAPYEIHQSCNKNMGIVIGVVTYSPLACFDKNNPDVIFAAKEVSGITQIFKLERLAANSFTSVQKTNEPFDQWRPTSTKGLARNVFWLNKVRYYHYMNDYNQQLIVDTI